MTSDIVHLTKQMPIPGKISFMGHSMGGRVGIQLALTYPELIDKLIVVDSAIFVNENVRERWTKLRNACYALVDIQHSLWEVQGYERMGKNYNYFVMVFKFFAMWYEKSMIFILKVWPIKL